MGRPQQPELARSGKTDLDPDHIGTELEARKAPETKGRTGPVPAENQPGHHPADESDKPDLDAFATKLGADAGTGNGDPPATAEARSSRSPQEQALALARTGLRLTGRTLGEVQGRLAALWRKTPLNRR